jgi:hypothetical protein
MNRLTLFPAHVVPKQGRSYHHEKHYQHPHYRPIESGLDLADWLALISELADEI